METRLNISYYFTKFDGWGWGLTAKSAPSKQTKKKKKKKRKKNNTTTKKDWKDGKLLCKA